MRGPAEPENDTPPNEIAGPFFKLSSMERAQEKCYGNFNATRGPHAATRFPAVDAVLSRWVEMQVLAIVPAVQ